MGQMNSQLPTAENAVLVANSVNEKRLKKEIEHEKLEIIEAKRRERQQVERDKEDQRKKELNCRQSIIDAMYSGKYEASCAVEKRAVESVFLNEYSERFVQELQNSDFRLECEFATNYSTKREPCKFSQISNSGRRCTKWWVVWASNDSVNKN